MYSIIIVRLLRFLVSGSRAKALAGKVVFYAPTAPWNVCEGAPACDKNDKAVTDAL